MSPLYVVMDCCTQSHTFIPYLGFLRVPLRYTFFHKKIFLSVIQQGLQIFNMDLGCVLVNVTYNYLNSDYNINSYN